MEDIISFSIAPILLKNNYSINLLYSYDFRKINGSQHSKKKATHNIVVSGFWYNSMFIVIEQ